MWLLVVWGGWGVAGSGPEWLGYDCGVVVVVWGGCGSVDVVVVVVIIQHNCGGVVIAVECSSGLYG